MKSRSSSNQASTRPLVEELERRLLLSADVFGAFAGNAVLQDVEQPANDSTSLTESDQALHADAADHQTRELIIVDSATPDYETLLADLTGQADEDRIFEVAILDPTEDGIEQITNLLSEYSGLDAVHIISHGSEGNVALGSSVLDYDALIENAREIEGWSDAFTEDGDLLIYGCNLAATDQGQDLVDALARLPEADVAASEDLTGADELGGDWDLEYQRGDIEASVAVSEAAQETWDGVLANTAPTFGDGDGMVTTAIGSGNDDAQSVVVQPDGKILVAGFSHNGSNNDFAITRYNADGTLDTSFDGDGVVTLPIGAGADKANSITLQADGKILVAGQSSNGSNDDFAVIRLNADGSLDTGFDGDGIVTTAIGSSDDAAQGVIVQDDGKIVVVGRSNNGTNNDFAVVRYNADGSLDTTFDSDGIVTTAIGSGDDRAFDVTLQTDGKILVTGRSNNGANNDFALVRYNTDGSLDTSFDTDGKLTTDFSSGNDTAYSVTVQADGKILVAGEVRNANDDFGLARYNTDGSLDTSFDGDGLASTAIGSFFDRAQDVAVQADGKIVVAGYSGNGSDEDFALVRYDTNGTLDTSFNGTGIVTTDFGSGNDRVQSVAVKADGTIIVVGRAHNGSDQDFALASYNADGSLDTSFDTSGSGILSGNPTFVEDGAPVVLDGDVTIYDSELSAADNFDGASLTLVRNGGASADDIFSATGNLAALTEGGNLALSGVTIGSVTTNSAGTLVLTFNVNATQARVDETLQSIAYANTSDTPPASVQIDWTFDDGNTGAQGSGGALTATGSTTVTIVETNDAPLNTVPGDQATAQDTELEFSSTNGNAITVSDADAGSNEIEVTLSVDNGTLTLDPVTAIGSETLVDDRYPVRARRRVRRRRQLRRRLARRQQPGRRRLGRLRPALRCQWQHGRWRVSRQHQHGQQSIRPQGRHG
jgi:uncharacterized delta-60 repeat protein